MQFTFEYPTRFEDGQAISAYDINKYRTNNALIRKLLYSPQQLPMDSNFYTPKSTPIHGLAIPTKTEDVVWKGSFLYRSGMKKAYLGMSINIENAVTTTGNAIPATSFKNDKIGGNAGLAVILKHTELTYKEIKAKTEYAGYWDAVDILSSINANVPIDNGKGIYFNVKYGKANASHTFPGTSWATIDGSKRITTIEVELEGYNRKFQDGEIVQISIIILPNKDNPLKSFNSINVDGGLIVQNQSYPYIKHMMLYAETDGDLSYSTNWANIPTVTTTGNNVLSKTNLNAISDKQTYLIERLSNRPSILTGSVIYYSLWAGTSSQRYISQDLANGSNEQIYFSSDNPTGKENEVKRAATTNAETSLSTFVWNPYLDIYPQLLINYKFYGNTAPQQFMIVDIPNGPTTLPTIRQTDNDPKNANNLFGNSTFTSNPLSSAPQPTSWSYSANSVKNLYETFSTITTPSHPRYKLFPFQIRIPSYSTPVFSVEDNEYKSDIFFRKGFYQDATAITFTSGETVGSYRKWKLPKAYDETTSGTYTSQVGFVAEIPENTISGLLRNTKHEYRQVPNYNNSDWCWISKVNEPAGHRPVFINLYDHSAENVYYKANYISFIHLIGASAFNSANISYTVDTDLEGNTIATYSGLRTTISGINADLDSFYTNLFDKNPHFNRYQMFWGAPQSFVNDLKVIQEYNEKFFMFTQCRRGDILIVRGKNVTLSYGEFTEITREGNPAGSLMSSGDVSITFEKTQGLISGNTEQTIIFNLSNADGLAYGQQYYLTGDVIYAAEFFEEPS